MSSRIRLLALIALACFAPAVFAQGYYSLPDSRPVRFYSWAASTSRPAAPTIFSRAAGTSASAWPSASREVRSLCGWK